MREGEASSRNSPAINIDPSTGKKKKGRPPKNRESAIEPDFDSTPNGKRKRGGKPVSVTPSIADEDVDDETLLEDDTLLDDDTLLEDEELVLETELEVNVADVRARRFPTYD